MPQAKPGAPGPGPATGGPLTTTGGPPTGKSVVGPQAPGQPSTTVQQPLTGIQQALSDAGLYAGPERRYSGPDRRQGDRRQRAGEVGALGGASSPVGDRRADRRAPAGSPVSAPAGPSGAKPKGPDRSRDFRKVFNMLKEVSSGSVGAEKHPAALAQLSAKPEGAHAVADALEATVVAQPQQMLDTLDELVKSPESRKSFGKTLSNMAESTPDRLVGILLLTSDLEGGKQALANVFSDLAAVPESSASLGKMLAAGSGTETAANGMKELLNGLLAPDGDDDFGRANQTVRSLAQATRSKGGARGVGQGLVNLMSAEGGARDLGAMVRTMSQTKEGARATTELLMNLSQDKQGAKDLSKVLARATKSEAGGRDVLKSFTKMARTDSGRNEVSRLLVRLTDSSNGAKMLSNMVRDKGNAKSFAALINSVSQSPQAATNLRFALQKAMADPGARREMELFRGRMSVEPSLREAVDKVIHAPVQSQPLQLSQSARGADAMARLTAFENLARAVSDTPLNPPVRTVESAGSSAAANDSGSKGSGGQQQQNPDSQAAQILQSQPYPDLGTVSDVWRVQSVVRVDGGERLAGMAAGASTEHSHGSETTQQEQNSAFRPGDVYSDLTLLRARICGDCGFRTNSIGECSRCGYALLDDTKPKV